MYEFKRFNTVIIIKKNSKYMRSDLHKMMSEFKERINELTLYLGVVYGSARRKHIKLKTVDEARIYAVKREMSRGSIEDPAIRLVGGRYLYLPRYIISKTLIPNGWAAIGCNSYDKVSSAKNAAYMSVEYDTDVAIIRHVDSYVRITLYNNGEIMPCQYPRDY